MAKKKKNVVENVAENVTENMAEKENIMAKKKKNVVENVAENVTENVTENVRFDFSIAVLDFKEWDASVIEDNIAILRERVKGAKENIPSRWTAFGASLGDARQITLASGDGSTQLTLPQNEAFAASAKANLMIALGGSAKPKFFSLSRTTATAGSLTGTAEDGSTYSALYQVQAKDAGGRLAKTLAFLIDARNAAVGGSPARCGSLCARIAQASGLSNETVRDTVQALTDARQLVRMRAELARREEARLKAAQAATSARLDGERAEALKTAHSPIEASQQTPDYSHLKARLARCQVAMFARLGECERAPDNRRLAVRAKQGLRTFARYKSRLAVRGIA